MASRVIFNSSGYEIEGLLNKKKGNQGVVITHPHPLYGGDMNNYVVGSIANAYQKIGYSTLIFNFRGVGKSQGRYEEGVGEREDVRAALAYLSDQGIQDADLAGYSFGAWVNAGLSCQTDGFRRMIMISPPVNLMDFSSIKSIPCLGLVVTGEDDEFASPDLIREMIPNWNPGARFEIMPNTDHFYGVSIQQLEKMITAHVKEWN
jgi:hypothetical protein